MIEFFKNVKYEVKSSLNIDHFVLQVKKLLDHISRIT